MHDVINFIINHGSEKKPITNREICSALNYKEQDVRKLISEARCEGIPICSSSKGYYYSENKANILETIHSLMGRTMAVEKAINGLVTRLMSLEEKK